MTVAVGDKGAYSWGSGGTDEFLFFPRPQCVSSLLLYCSGATGLQLLLLLHWVFSLQLAHSDVFLAVIVVGAL